MDKAENRKIKLFDEIFRKNLGKRISGLRKAKDLTQESLSERVGMSLPAFGNIEIGKRYPESVNLVKIALALDVDIADLFKFSDAPENKLLHESILMLESLKNDEKTLKAVHAFLKEIR